MIEQAGPDLFMFSSDYPHPEGGKDPLAKFEEALWTTGGRRRDRFYHDNMAELLSGSRRCLTGDRPTGGLQGGAPHGEEQQPGTRWWLAASR